MEQDVKQKFQQRFKDNVDYVPNKVPKQMLNFQNRYLKIGHTSPRPLFLNQGKEDSN
jgi:hypothetical protein